MPVPTGCRRRLATLAALAWAAGAAGAGAAGVVGSGTPASCTEAALNAALAGGGTVSFSCGGGPVVIPLSATKVISTSTTLDGSGEQVTLDGGHAVRHFLTTYQVPALTTAGIALTLRHLTLRNGRASDFGGAIRLVYQEPSRRTTLTLDDVAFEGNVAAAAGADVGGGALYAQGGLVTITGSRFSGNRGGNGGAIGSLQAVFTISDSRFEGNATHATAGGQGGHGGAIYIDGSSLGLLTIRRTSFTGNSAAAIGGAIHTWLYGLPSGMLIEDSSFASNAGVTNGGAIFHMNGSLTISGSTFAGNSVVGQGGALWLRRDDGRPADTPVSVTNSTFWGNQATGYRPNTGSVGLGGAIANSGATSLALSHVTIVGNHADWVGGGIMGASGATLRASIVANNTAANGGNAWSIQKNCAGTLGDGGANVQWPAPSPSDAQGRCAAGVALVDPLLGGLAANGGLTATLAPLVGSPAIDRVASGCPPPGVDQRGFARPQGPRCDTGAVEWRPSADLGVALAGASPVSAGGTIEWTITATNAGPLAASGALLTDAFPALVGGVSWTCTSSAGSSCPASGSGPLSASVSLLPGGSVTIRAQGTVGALGAARHVTNTVTIATPAGLDDPVAANDSASVATPVERQTQFYSVTPCRAVDTRGAAGPRGGPALAAGVARTFPIAGACEIPATAWAVSLNATVTGPTAGGNVRLYPGGTPVPATSTLNYAAGLTRANNAVVALGEAGDLSALASQASGSTQLVLDVNGYFE
jgi:uncharacterized repeat protein (TIGR01451 family)